MGIYRIDTTECILTNDKRTFKIIAIKEPLQIKLVEITYGDNNNDGYWSSLENYFDYFRSVCSFAGLSQHQKLKNIQTKV